MKKESCIGILPVRIQHRSGWIFPVYGIIFSVTLLVLALFCHTSRTAAGNSDGNVTTYHNDNARTGAYTNEVLLTPGNVNVASFGKLFSCPVDGKINTQPLYVSGVNIPGKGVHNVVFVATEHDSVYAFDADNNTGLNAAPLWQVSFIDPANGITTVPWQDVTIDDIVPEIGITGTPVIDTATGTIYVVAKTKETTNGVSSYVARLHALDIQTGQERPGSPISIGGSVSGTGNGSSGGVMKFQAKWQNQRAGLLLLNGVVYIAFGSHGDKGPYHGWLFGYNAQTLKRTVIFCTTPNGEGAGVWHGGSGPSADGQGNIYMASGDGTFDANTNGGIDFGDSVIKFGTNGTPGLLDYFTPYNQSIIDQADQDLGSSGSVVLPDAVGSASHPHLIVNASKEGRVYLLDRDNLGHYNANSDSQIVQWLPITGLYGVPAYFNGRLYVCSSNRPIKAFGIANGQLTSTPVSQTNTLFTWPGCVPVVSSDPVGASAIVWAIEQGLDHAVLHAYNAYDLSQELYNSDQGGSRDALGDFVKFSTPTVANGKVYVPEADRLTVLGNGSWLSAPTIMPYGADTSSPVSVTIQHSSPDVQIRYTTDGTEPTDTSPLYSGALVVTQSTTIKAKAFQNGFQPSGTTTAYFLIGTAPGNGDGLLANYYTNNSLTDPFALTRVDPSINFDWAEGTSPAPGIPATNFSIRWTGWLQPRFSGAYTISTLSDDGIRVWLNNQPIIDNWTPSHRELKDSVTVNLDASKQYAIRVDYYQKTRYAVARLLWASAGLPEQPIPTSQLVSQINSAGVVFPKPLTISFNPSTVLGSTSSTGTVTFDQAPAQDTVVTLSSANPAAFVPATCTLSAGQTKTTFPITTTSVTAYTAGRIKATCSGVTVSANINVRPVGVNTLSFRPNPAHGGTSVTSTITLEGPAPSGGMVVNLSSADTTHANPTVSSVTIPEGATTGTFTIATTAVTANTPITMTAATPGKNKTSVLTLIP